MFYIVGTWFISSIPIARSIKNARIHWNPGVFCLVPCLLCSDFIVK